MTYKFKRFVKSPRVNRAATKQRLGRYMGLGKKTGGRNFQPGESGNPAGRAPLPPEIKEAREYNKLEVERILREYMGKTKPDIEAILESSEVPVIELIVAKIVIEAFKKGDHFRFDFLLNRLIGKVKENVVHSGQVTLESLVAGSNGKEKSP